MMLNNWNSQISSFAYSSEELPDDLSHLSVKESDNPRLDFSSMHQYMSGSEPVVAGTDYSISLTFQRAKNEDVGFVQHIEEISTDKSASPVTPASFVSSRFFETASFNTGEKELDEAKKLTKKISEVKKAIKKFDLVFVTKYGRMPTFAEKTADRRMNKLFTDLKGLRKLWKIMREFDNPKKLLSSKRKECEDLFFEAFRRKSDHGEHSSNESLNSNDDHRYTWPLVKHESEYSSVMDIFQPPVQSIMDDINDDLQNSRLVNYRPENIKEMNNMELCKERIELQKSIAKVECLYGKFENMSAEMQESVRSLYERYRIVRRMISSSLSRISLNLDTVPELDELEFDEATDFLSTNTSLSSSYADLSLFSPLPSPISSPKTTNAENVNKNDSIITTAFANIDESQSYVELLSEQDKMKSEKRRLQKTLLAKDSKYHSGSSRRKHSKENIQQDQLDYKQVKGKLRLLSALLKKKRLSIDDSFHGVV